MSTRAHLNLESMYFLEVLEYGAGLLKKNFRQAFWFLRACMLQPRGGSDARADFAEQVAVWILDCPLVVGGIAPGPSAGRRPARVRSRAPKRR